MFLALLLLRVFKLLTQGAEVIMTLLSLLVVVIFIVLSELLTLQRQNDKYLENAQYPFTKIC